MRRQSYLLQYVKIYIWQGVSLILNFLSMFVVVPYLTKDPSTYGIYSVCISVSIFLAYSDLGFMAAGQKYAAEHYSRNEKEDEIKVIGFTSFILLIFILLCSAIFLYLGFNPQVLLKDLNTPAKVSIASKLLIILACFAPLTVIQRITQVIFSIRLEDYVIQRIFCVASALKIVSVLYFFGGSNYLIVEYFLFSQVITAIAYLTFLAMAYYRYKYDFRLFVQCFRFDKGIYKKVNSLALSSLYVTIAWILYYELDSVVIGKFLGVDKVAIYAIGLTMLSFFRSIFGILFSPFSVRFNHFVGVKDTEGLKIFVRQVIQITLPLVIFPIIAQVITTRSFVLSWVGASYEQSTILAQILIFCNIFAFISYPTSMLLLAQEKIKQMYTINTIIPAVYWIGIIGLYSILGLKSFAVFTFIAFLLSASYYTFYLLKFLDTSFISFLKSVLEPVIIPVVFLVIVLLGANGFLPHEKSKINLILVMGVTGIGVLLSFFIQYFFSAKTRKTVNELLFTIKQNK
ncbi:lipopolysaccharide biosynthesis protein [Mucilaginibacter mali]|uniref:Lipopolysaccharide biosynthesis protein n=1 Tax=Mucilaginibacter mali TaxID=2740462 RepID=A0A7D4Q9J0_9SPHI|nr:lipopolysaccharide biosynthesis protein [Mucilaginibacter mali]QKJ29404.1 lipopolysaccharide biosynthesis protein [Mucilaginibacter mali]